LLVEARFFPSPPIPYWLCDHPSLISNGNRALFTPNMKLTTYLRL